MKNFPKRRIATLVIEKEAMRWSTKRMSKKERLPIRKLNKTKRKKKKSHLPNSMKTKFAKRPS
jgi:hypothetical protein